VDDPVAFTGGIIALGGRLEAAPPRTEPPVALGVDARVMEGGARLVAVVLKAGG